LGYSELRFRLWFGAEDLCGTFLNVRRATALETAYGCEGGAKL